MKPKTIWTSNELRALAKQMVSLGLQEEYDPPEFLALLRRAQRDVLEEYRRRNVITISQFTTLIPEVTTQLRLAKQVAEIPDPYVEPESPPEQAIPMAAIEGEGRPLQGLAESIDLILEMEAEKIARRFLHHLQKAFQRISDEEVGKFLHVAVETRQKFSTARKPRICVVGLLPSQAGMMEKEFSSHLDLRFIVSEMPVPSAVDRAKGADRTIALVNFMSHSMDGALSKGCDEYQRLPGGLDKLRNLLTDITADYLQGLQEERQNE